MYFWVAPSNMTPPQTHRENHHRTTLILPPHLPFLITLPPLQQQHSQFSHRSSSNSPASSPAEFTLIKVHFREEAWDVKYLHIKIKEERGRKRKKKIP